MTDSEKFFLCVRNWLTVFLPKQRCLSDNSIKAYKATLNLMIRFLREDKKMKLEQIGFSTFDRDLIQAFLCWLGATKGSSASTQNSRLMALRSFFNYAGMTDVACVAVQQDISKVPMKKCSGKVVNFLSEQALKTLLETPDPTTRTGMRNRFFMILMYDTGGRCQELLDLKLKDFVLQSGKSYVYLTGKGAKQRSVPILPKTVRHYEQYLKAFHPAQNAESYVFYTVSHNARHQMSPDSVENFMKRYGELAKKRCPEIPARVHPHQLRHTRAMHLYRGGMPLPFLAELLGHANITTTNVYAYADTEMKREALERAALPTAPVGSEACLPKWAGNEDMILRLSGLR